MRPANKMIYAKMVGDLEGIISVLESLHEFEDADVLEILRDKYLSRYLEMTSVIYGEVESNDVGS